MKELKGAHQPQLGKEQAIKLHLRVKFQIVLNFTGLACFIPEIGCKAINSAQYVIKGKKQGLCIYNTYRGKDQRQTEKLSMSVLR